MPSSPDYSNKILADTRNALGPRISALQAAFDSLRSHLIASVDQLMPKLEALQSIELPNAEQIVSEAMRDAAWQNQVEVNLLAEFASGMRRKETQEEILSLLLDTAHQFAYGVALFVVRGDEIAGWSSRGFSPDTSGKFGSCAFTVTDISMLQKALGNPGIITIPHPPEDQRLKEMFQDEPLTTWHLLPMRALQRPIALLVACDSQDRNCNLDSLRILMDFTSLCVENLALKILQELRTTEAPEGEAAARTPGAEVEEGAAAAETASEPIPVKVHSPDTSVERDSVSPRIAEKKVVEKAAPPEFSPVVSAPVQQTPEPVSEPSEPAKAFSLADVVSSAIEGTPAPAAPASSPARSAASPEDEKFNADARRFARLLVSEIKLYNEQRLLEARARGQIYLKLRRDIDRSREMYEKRFPFTQARKVDHFHDELVRILAENDSAKLGGDYPGPRGGS